MRLTADREHLADVVGWVAQVIPKNPQNAALTGVRLTLADSTLSVEATDYDTTHKATLDVMGGDDGAVLVNGYLLRDLANGLRGQDVSLFVESGQLVIAAGKSNYRTRLLTIEDFPNPLTVNRKSKAAVSVGETDADDLRRATAAVLHLVEDEAADTVRGLRLESTDAGLTLVGAQTAALAIADSPLGKRGKVTLETQVPGGIFNKAVRGLSGTVKISHSEGAVELADADRVVTFRTYATKFVQWRSVLREKSPYVVDLKAAELLEAVRRAVIVSPDRDTSPVDLEFGDNTIQVRAGGEDDAPGTGLEVLDIDDAGEGAQVRVSGKYLIPALATFTGRVRVEMIPGQIKAIILSSLDDEPVRHIIMPRRQK